MTRRNEHDQPVGPDVPGWETRPRPRPVTLRGLYVDLEPVAPEHAEDLFTALCQPGDAALWTYRTHEPSDVGAMREMLSTLADDDDTVTLAIVPSGGRPQGMASYQRIEPEHGQVEVAAVIFARALQRTRAATEAMSLMMRHAFDDLGYRRYEWKCDSLNEPSRRAAYRLGFTFEGTFRQHMVYRGRNRDTDWFSVTDEEWPTVRAAHDRWLDPANFDEDGRQREALSRSTD